MTTLPEIAPEPDAVDIAPAKPSSKDIYDSLNYFDEIAVKNTFGEELLALKQRKNAFMRALIYSDLRKNHGLKDATAKDRVFTMLNAEVQEWFAIEEAGPKCTSEACPCVEHVREDEDEDPTESLS